MASRGGVSLPDNWPSGSWALSAQLGPHGCCGIYDFSLPLTLPSLLPSVSPAPIGHSARTKLTYRTILLPGVPLWMCLLSLPHGCLLWEQACASTGAFLTPLRECPILTALLLRCPSSQSWSCESPCSAPWNAGSSTHPELPCPPHPVHFGLLCSWPSFTSTVFLGGPMMSRWWGNTTFTHWFPNSVQISWPS